MKLSYLIAGLVLIVFIVGCAEQAAPPAAEGEGAAPPATAEGEGAAPPATAEGEGAAPPATAEGEGAEGEAADTTPSTGDLDQTKAEDASGLNPAVVENWKKACRAGNGGLCAALKRYGIDPNE